METSRLPMFGKERTMVKLTAKLFSVVLFLVKVSPQRPF
jgi:hypothetical protein